MVDYKRYVREPVAIDLIDKLLTLYPKQRIDINKAVDSKFFTPKSSSTENLKLLLSTCSSISNSNDVSHNVQRQ